VFFSTLSDRNSVPLAHHLNLTTEKTASCLDVQPHNTVDDEQFHVSLGLAGWLRRTAIEELAVLRDELTSPVLRALLFDPLSDPTQRRLLVLVNPIGGQTRQHLL